ncbi:CoA pyrophosphatase [Chitinibacter fontanus]|uniref:CoA pyrophosphatase n=1 Tax=Chitinibacter fontanus TaxID=1737446 RepID=A0A7D5VCM0_9NEIS|nr:CoA pyrophosphatase [Chitinibacter fontanus]QLI83092.1 CoA pyrophosphatase [Chitinibacter fontanus]
MLPTDPEVLIPWLQARLAAIKPSSVSADHPHVRVERKAAVLIGMVLHPQQVTVLFTQRAQHLSVHAGQVSFPGGAIELTDVDAVDAALRETEEEVGIPRAWICPCHTLGEYRTISGFAVTPVLATLEPNYPVQADANEVAEVFELPLDVVLNPARYERRWIERPEGKGVTHFLEHDGRVVWGATAGMLLQLSASLGLPGIPVDKTNGG